jgi:DeoR family transcriptional regulator, fructose operon transcriptional repressor
MGVIMFIEERLESLLAYLNEKGRLTVQEAIEYMNVSADTVRRDFNRLALNGLATRTYGGIIPLENTLFDPSIKEKSPRYQQEKKAIAKLAANLIEDEDSIIIDAGTTTEKILDYIPASKKITIITDALNVAIASSQRGFETIILGGVIRNETLSIIGPDAVAMMKHYHADKLFLGVSTLSIESGMMVPNRMEAEIKAELIKKTNQVILMADHSKLDKTGFFTLGSLHEIDILITDSAADPEFIQRVEEQGVEVLLSNSK